MGNSHEHLLKNISGWQLQKLGSSVIRVLKLYYNITTTEKFQRVNAKTREFLLKLGKEIDHENGNLLILRVELLMPLQNVFFSYIYSKIAKPTI